MVERTHNGPLGMPVIELAHIMAGPVCGLMLADMGADVDQGGKARTATTPAASVPPRINGESAAFMMMNRNKRGIVLDLKSEGHRPLAPAASRTADVVIENYRMGTMEKLGLGYDELRKDNPGLIYARDIRLRPHRPLCRARRVRSHRPGHVGPDVDHRRRTRPPPVKVGAPVSDITAGIMAPWASALPTPTS